MCLYLPIKKILHAFLLLSICCIVSSQANKKQENEEVATDSILLLTYLASNNIQETKFKEALEYSIKAVDLAQNTEDKSLKSAAYNSLANSYQQLKKNKIAEKYFNISLEFAKEVNDLNAMSSALNGLANVEMELYDNKDKAVEYYKESFKYTVELNQPLGIYVAAANLTDLMLDIKDTDQAKKYVRIVRKVYDYYNSNPENGSYIPFYHFYLNSLEGKYYKQIENNQKALEHYDIAIKIGEEQKYHLDLIDVYKSRAEIFKSIGKYNLAIESMERQMFHAKNNNDIENKKQIEIISAKFRVEEIERELLNTEKEKEILLKLSESKSKTITITIISIAMLLILLGLMYFSYKKWKSNYELQSLNKSLETSKNNAERLTKLKSNFISRVSHEIRTPLYSVIGITSILEEDKDLKKKHLKLIDALKFSGQHLIKLVETVLDIRQIEAQNIQLNITNNNLQSIIENIVNCFKFQAKEKNNILSLTIDKTVSENYRFDNVRLSEVLINLIENAIKFTNNGTILISVALEESLTNRDTLLFKVKDTGEGILEDNLALIFDNFNQANEEQNIYDGAGLGLPTVKHLLELMNSRIYLESKYGEGSTFSFSLTLPKGEAYNLDSKPKTKAGIISKKILIVEDNKMSQMVTSNLIRLIGYECSIEDNGLKAFERVQQEDFDLILMDLNMPVMNGFESSIKIKAHNPEAVIIALTATDIYKVRKECINSGMEDVYNKPISKKQLDFVIKKYTNQNRRIENI